MPTALLVIDVQLDVLAPLTPERRAGLLATLADLITRARQRGDAVVYIQHEDDYMKSGSPSWQIAAEVAPRAGEPVVAKRFRDSFRETKLADVLSERGIDHVILCGMQTEFCVDATLREAERRGYRVTLVADAHATYPDGDVSEKQIRDHVHRVAAEIVTIATAAQVYPIEASSSR